MLFFDNFKGSREDAVSTGFLCTDVDKALTVQFRYAHDTKLLQPMSVSSLKYHNIYSTFFPLPGCPWYLTSTRNSPETSNILHTSRIAAPSMTPSFCPSSLQYSTSLHHLIPPVPYHSPVSCLPPSFQPSSVPPMSSPHTLHHPTSLHHLTSLPHSAPLSSPHSSHTPTLLYYPTFFAMPSFHCPTFL